MGFSLKSLVPGHDPVSKAVIDREVKNYKAVRDFVLDKDDKKAEANKPAETTVTAQAAEDVGSPDIASLGGADATSRKPGHEMYVKPTNNHACTLSQSGNNYAVGGDNMQYMLQMLVEMLMQMFAGKTSQYG